MKVKETSSINDKQDLDSLYSVCTNSSMIATKDGIQGNKHYKLTKWLYSKTVLKESPESHTKKYQDYEHLEQSPDVQFITMSSLYEFNQFSI